MPATYEDLGQRARRWKRALADSATGPLIIAPEIVDLAEHWEQYKAEAGGQSCTAWLQSVLTRGQNYAYFYARHRAVERLGEASRRTMHHEVAVYVTNNVQDQYIDAVKLMLMRECKAQNGNPLTLAQAKPRIHEITGHAAQKREAKGCDRCMELEAKLKEAGISAE